MIHALLQSIINKLDKEYNDVSLSTTHAWWLLETLFRCSKTDLIVKNKTELNDLQQKQLSQWLDEIIIHKKPIQYIIGSVPFNDLTIMVKTPTLIPRPETEEWCAHIISQLKKLTNKHISILDLATGSGCIGLALAYHFPQAHVSLVDISSKALELAKKNVALNKISNATYIQSDLFDNIPSGKRYDIILSNPPYITEQEYTELDESVKNWEDPQALYTTDQGLALIKKIITRAPSFLQQNEEMKLLNIPQLILEIGYKQGTLVHNLMNNAGYTMISIHKDFAQRDRVVTGRIEYVANSKDNT